MATNKKSKSGNDPSLQDDDQAFLSQIEDNIRSKGNEQLDAKLEAEHRAQEMERIRRASANIPVPGRTTPAAPTKPTAPTPEKKSNPLENDPRYREYFERLRRQKGEKTPTPAAGTPNQPTPGATPTPAASQKVGPGSIVCFDDKSIGIYKDAVSGRDYALFYFLNPDGTTTPEGVFLQCYQARVIGSLPEEHFAQLRDADHWNRDMIVFHLTKFDHVKDLDQLALHQERKPSATKPRNPTIQETPQPAPAQASQPHDESTPSSKSAPPAPTSPAKEQDGLVKGRRFQIKFSGKKWEAVYWTSEGENSIVAHSTHGTWSLMRLDLSRFKDSLELLDVVDSETLEAIAEQAAAES